MTHECEVPRSAETIMRSDEAPGQFSQLELGSGWCPGLRQQGPQKNRVLGVRDSMKPDRETYLIRSQGIHPPCSPHVRLALLLWSFLFLLSPLVVHPPLSFTQSYPLCTETRSCHCPLKTLQRIYPFGVMIQSRVFSVASQAPMIWPLPPSPPPPIS